MLKYKLNPININSIMEFGRIRGSRSGDNRNTYMIKFVGVDNNTNKDINALRKYLTEEMHKEKIYYKYIDFLEIKGDCKAQKDAYEGFISTGHIDLPIVREGNIAESQIISAIKDMQKLIHKYKKNITDTILKNIMVKILYLLEENFSDVKIDGDRNIKVVAENIKKDSEIYFFVFLNLLGMDVCLLQYSEDISMMEDYYATKKLGNFFEGKMVYEDIISLVDTRPTNAPKVQGTEENKRVTISLESIRRKDRDNKTKVIQPVGNGDTIRSAPASINEGSQNTTLHGTNTGNKKSASPPTNIKRDRELSYVELARLSTSIVMIAVFDSRKKIIGTGSGIMIGRDGFILTNDHVIKGGSYFEVRIEDDERIYETYEVIKYNPHLDLAIIRIPRALNPLELYDGRETLVRGQKVVAIGSPLGLFNSVSDGIISGFRNIDNVDMIQFSAPISPGSSGGAVLNMYGEVIGISTAGFAEGQNINLAVPYDALYNFAKSFIR